jgi:hypothetical protein
MIISNQTSSLPNESSGKYFILGQEKNGHLFVIEFSVSQIEIKTLILEKTPELVGFTKIAVNNKSWKVINNNKFELTDKTWSSFQDIRILFPGEENLLCLSQIKNDKFYTEKLFISTSRAKTENICTLHYFAVECKEKNYECLLIAEENSCSKF